MLCADLVSLLLAMVNMYKGWSSKILEIGPVFFGRFSLFVSLV